MWRRGSGRRRTRRGNPRFGLPGWLWHTVWLVPLAAAAVIAATRDSGARVGAPPRIVAFAVEPVSAGAGRPLTVRWEVVGAETVRIDPLPGDVAISGVATIAAPTAAPDGGVGFVLTATNAGHTRTSGFRVQIATDPPAVLRFGADPATAGSGAGTRLSWDVAGSDVAVSIEPGDGTVYGPRSSVAVLPAKSTRYALVATNAAGRVVNETDVVVDGIAPLPPVVERFEATVDGDPQSGPDRARLAWRVTGAEVVSLDDGTTTRPVAASGELSPPAPAGGASYLLLAKNDQGVVARIVAAPASSDPAPTVMVPTPAVVVVPLAEPRGAAAPAPDGSQAGNTIDGLGARAIAAPHGAPAVSLFSVGPARPRAGEAVTVRWAVTGASSVRLRGDPTIEIPEAASSAPSGVFRFVAATDTTLSLDAVAESGAVVRRQTHVTVVRPAGPPVEVAFDKPTPAVVAVDTGAGGARTAVVTGRGDVWLYAADRWTEIDAIGSGPVAAAFAGNALFVADRRGDVWRVAPERLFAIRRARSSPWGADPRLVLGRTCGRATSLAGARDAAGEATLLVGCADPNRVMALAVGGESITGDAPRWTHDLPEAPAVLRIGSSGGNAVAVAYAPIGPLASRIDLMRLDVRRVETFALPGAVTTMAPSADGAVVVAAVAGDPALHVVEVGGTGPRRVELEDEVGSIAWLVSDGTVRDGSAAPPAATPDLGGADAAAPALAPASGTEPVPDALGTVVVAWQSQPGGAAVSLDPWVAGRVVLRIEPERTLAAVGDDGAALVVVSRAPGRGAAYPWRAGAEDAP